VQKACDIQDVGRGAIFRIMVKVTLCAAKCTISVTDIAVGHSLCLDIA